MGLRPLLLALPTGDSLPQGKQFLPNGLARAILGIGVPLFFKIFFFFLMWTIFKVFIEFIIILFLFFVCLLVSVFCFSVSVMRPVGSYLPSQGSSPYPLYWEVKS